MHCLMAADHIESSKNISRELDSMDFVYMGTI